MNCDIDKILKEVIVSSCDDINIDMINNNTNLIDDLSFDSIKIIQLIIEIENVFSIEINDDELSFELLAPYKLLYELVCGKLEDK